MVQDQLDTNLEGSYTDGLQKIKRDVLVTFTGQFRFDFPSSLLIKVTDRHPSASMQERVHDSQPDTRNTTSHQRNSVFQQAQV